MAPVKILGFISALHKGISTIVAERQLGEKKAFSRSLSQRLAGFFSQWPSTHKLTSSPPHNSLATAVMVWPHVRHYFQAVFFGCVFFAQVLFHTWPEKLIIPQAASLSVYICLLQPQTSRQRLQLTLSKRHRSKTIFLVGPYFPNPLPPKSLI